MASKRFTDSSLLSFFRRPASAASQSGSSSSVLQQDLLEELGLSGVPTDYRILGRQGSDIAGSASAERGVDDLAAFKASCRAMTLGQGGVLRSASDQVVACRAPMLSTVEPLHSTCALSAQVTCSALSDLGCTDGDIRNTFSLLGALLHLGAICS